MGESIAAATFTLHTQTAGPPLKAFLQRLFYIYGRGQRCFSLVPQTMLHEHHQTIHASNNSLADSILHSFRVSYFCWTRDKLPARQTGPRAAGCNQQKRKHVCAYVSVHDSVSHLGCSSWCRSRPSASCWSPWRRCSPSRRRSCSSSRRAGTCTTRGCRRHGTSCAC